MTRRAVASIFQRAAVIAGDIKLAHSVFALPFALLAAVMALAAPADRHARGTGEVMRRALDASAGRSASGVGIDGWRDAATVLALVVGAMVAARTAAMISNRLLDRAIDARNPRTKGRALPSGRLGTRDAIIGLVVSSIAFIAICAGFGVLRGNWWPLILAAPVLAWITLYGLFKRFTWACHLWLGASLAMSVPAAALAVEPTSLSNPALWWLAGAVFTWVAGFDVIYALQDVEIDRAEGLQSVPARFGWSGALWSSRALHAASVACLALAWRSDERLGTPFAAAVVIATLLLVIEHATVRRWGTTRMALTFFTLNGCVSLLLGAAGIAGILLA